MTETIYTYLPTVSVRSQLIYTTVLLGLVGAVAALPFIYVDVSVRASGLVRPVAERSEIKAQMGGIVAALYMRLCKQKIDNSNSFLHNVMQ